MSNLFPTSRDSFFPQFFDQAFESFFTPMTQPNVDIEENDHSYMVTMDIPGMNKEDINVTYNNNVLTIEAQQDHETESKDSNTNYIRRERVSRAFRRQFVVENVNTNDIKCKYQDGVLNIDLPKNDQVLEENHRIDIE